MIKAFLIVSLFTAAIWLGIHLSRSQVEIPAPEEVARNMEPPAPGPSHLASRPPPSSPPPEKSQLNPAAMPASALPSAEGPIPVSPHQEEDPREAEERRLALSNGDSSTVKTSLKKAAEIEGSPTLNTFGPNFTLARELLLKKENSAVLAYIEACQKFWKSESAQRTAERWKEEVSLGKIPDFGASIFH